MALQMIFLQDLMDFKSVWEEFNLTPNVTHGSALRPSVVAALTDTDLPKWYSK